MSGANEVARNLLAQEPGRENRHANAAGISKLAHKKRGHHKNGTPYRITPSAGDPFRIVVSGRVQWALEELRRAGVDGITSYTNPAPRLSAYVHTLRESGVEIETITEPHEGDFPGHHARYVLRSGAVPNWKGGAL
tara:strand:+ start:1649 stop:2056 length:408 start_codon:yes stop_codon:yes gene_type:complete